MYNTRKFYEIRGEIWQSRGNENFFREIGGKWTERTKIEGEMSNLWVMTKKGHQKFW